MITTSARIVTINEERNIETEPTPKPHPPLSGLFWRAVGGFTGIGERRIRRDAYSTLALDYRAGDRIFFLGFSRALLVGLFVYLLVAACVFVYSRSAASRHGCG